MKKNSRKEIALVASGVILGASIAAPAAGAALIAQQSSQKIVVDGRPVQIEAYSINGNNYAKLRDIGRAVGFAVEYDAAEMSAILTEVSLSVCKAYKEVPGLPEGKFDRDAVFTELVKKKQKAKGAEDEE